jgi:hypothetical protein
LPLSVYADVASIKSCMTSSEMCPPSIFRLFNANSLKRDCVH